MKKITNEEYQKLEFKLPETKARSPLNQQLMELGVGEHLMIDKSEWKLKSLPQNLISNSSYHSRGVLRGKKFKVQTLFNDAGWIITREEDNFYHCSVCKQQFGTRPGARKHLAQAHANQGRVNHVLPEDKRVRGVYQDRDKWIASAYKNGKRQFGRFNTFEEAVAARKQMSLN